MARRASLSPPVIAGHSYVRPLGSGGFAEVFLYEQDMPRRVVAVKVLDADAWAGDSRRAFEAEADVMARLSNHPSIVSIYQASISADGHPFIAMEYCPDTMRARARGQGQPLGLAEVLDVGVRMAGALETAHRSGVLHRDIKPSNVLVTSLGRPVLSDFGIAGVLGAEQQEEQVAMSLPWASPEVAQTREAGSVPSEIWSLGATLYSFAAGHTPFERPDRAENSRSKMTARITRAAYVGLPNGSAYGGLDEVLATAMSRQPGDRYASMLALAEALRALQRAHRLDVTPLDVLSADWASSALTPVGDAPRGPVISTVAPDSRRRARRLARGDSGRTGAGRGRSAGGRGLSPALAAVLGAAGALLVAGIGVTAVLLLGGGG